MDGTKKTRAPAFFYSDVRTIGLRLAILAHLFPRDVSLKPYYDLLAQKLSGPSERYTTQELAWGLSAYGASGNDKAQDTPAASLWANTKKISADASTNGGVLGWTMPLDAALTAGSLILENEAETPITALMVQEGIVDIDALRTGAESIRVHRTLLDETGDTMAPTRLKLGQLIYAKVELENLSDRPLQHIALVDRLPGGWELEQNFSSSEHRPDWLEGERQWSITHANKRDDRVEVFGTLPARRTVEYVYAIRVVTAGEFVLPGVEAVAMYAPMKWGRDKPSLTRIQGPWALEP